MERDRILALLRRYKEKSAPEYHIDRIGVFGSHARGDAAPESDIDVVVEMSRPDMFAMVHIKEELEAIFRTRVDLVRKRRNMNPYLKKYIDRDAVYV
jgi:predicted nucleotidyltransferase